MWLWRPPFYLGVLYPHPNALFSAASILVSLLCFTGMLARFHNLMGNDTIHSLEIISREITRIFCRSAMVDRIAAMLNYFLVHLVK